MSTPFAQLGLNPQLVEAVRAAGYENPTPIQERCIPLLLAGRDLLGQAQTGTGKTAAFGLPMLQSVAPGGAVQGLVLTPTRELAIQVSEQLQLWSKEVRTLAVYGGQPIPVQFKALRQGVQIVVATPGRLIDHLERGSISLDELRYCVLDEADEMLDFGFEEELNTILEKVPPGCRMALFSATFPTKIKQLAGRHLAAAEKVLIESSQRTVGTVEQYFSLVKPGFKTRALGRLLDHQDPGPTLIFCRTRQETQTLTDELRARGYLAECLHGEMDQSERERVMDRFRQNQCRTLVATDIAARGLDVDGITHVFNYDIPWDVENYIHRVGRTARAGRSGVAITVIEPSQQRHLQRLERESGAHFKPYPVPSPQQIESGRRKRFAARVRELLEDPRAQEQLPLVASLAKELDPMAIAAAALQALWQRSYSAEVEDDGQELSPAPKQYVWIGLSLGRRDGMNPSDLLRAMHDATGLSKIDLGKIHIEDGRTLLEVPAERADQILLALRKGRLRGQRFKADMAAAPAGAGKRGRKEVSPRTGGTEGGRTTRVSPRTGGTEGGRTTRVSPRTGGTEGGRTQRKAFASADEGAHPGKRKAPRPSPVPEAPAKARRGYEPAPVGRPGRRASLADAASAPAKKPGKGRSDPRTWVGQAGKPAGKRGKGPKIK